MQLAQKPWQTPEPRGPDPVHRAIAEARGRGESLKEIAEKFALEPSALRVLFKQPDFVRLVLDMQTVAGQPIELRIQNAAIAAYEKKYELLFTSADPKVTNSVATDFLDRALGRPTQRTENINLVFNASEDSKQLDGSIKAITERIEKFEAERNKLLEDMKKVDQVEEQPAEQARAIRQVDSVEQTGAVGSLSA